MILEQSEPFQTERPNRVADERMSPVACRLSPDSPGRLDGHTFVERLRPRLSATLSLKFLVGLLDGLTFVERL